MYRVKSNQQPAKMTKNQYDLLSSISDLKKPHEKQQKSYQQKSVKNTEQKSVKNTDQKKSEISLPQIYNTDIPQQLENFLTSNDHSVCILQMPTGKGKTVCGIRKLGEVFQKLKNSGDIVESYCLMPFRVSVKEMFKYQNHLNQHMTPVNVGYAMRGDKVTTPNDSVRIVTVGYWLEQFLGNVTQGDRDYIMSPSLVMVDEAHDAQWQTDLALRLLLWQLNNGAPIKIIISSATIDVADTIKTIGSQPLIISDEQKNTNVETIFCNPDATPVSKGKMQDSFYKEIMMTVEKAYKESNEGHILVMMPGQDEISVLTDLLENSNLLDNAEIHHLYSQMAREDIDNAIKPSKDVRKIIISTNIVENAITIDGLTAVVDCGYRKINSIDKEGVQQLELIPASKSNLIQCYGRVGRQGKKGFAYIMMSEDEFEMRDSFTQSEVHRNPLYPQLMKLYKYKLPLYSILTHVSRTRIDNDTEFLIKHKALERLSNNDIIVTKIGDIMAQLPCSIRAGHFLALVLTDKNLKPSWYTAVTIASWIDMGVPMFYRINRRPKESYDNFESRSLELEESQKEYMKEDCLITMLNIWFSSWVEAYHHGGLREWCKKNGIFEKTMRDMTSSVNHIISSLSNLRFEVPIPNTEECNEILDNLVDIKKSLVGYLRVAFSDWEFSLVCPAVIFAQKFAQYRRDSDYFGPKYIIDRGTKNTTSHSTKPSKKVLALGLRRINYNLIFMSNIVNLDDESDAQFEKDVNDFFE